MTALASRLLAEAEITVHPDMVALVDASDAEALSRHKWYAKKSRHTAYAVRSRSAKEGNGPWTISMHRQIMCPEDGRQVDHVNGNGLDNRLGPSGYRGVRRAYSGRGKPSGWRAAAKVNGKTVNIGRFVQPEDAARAYDAFVRIHHGEFAVLNFPDQTKGAA